MATAAVPVAEIRPSAWAWLAALVSLAAVAGSLYLSIGMGLKACPLCLYERTFALGAAGVLWVGLLARAGRVGVLALPLAGGGLAVAGLHVYLEGTGVMECPHGLGGIGSAPQQSLAAFGLLTLLLFADGFRAGLNALAPVAVLVLGALLGYGAIASAPKRVTPEYEKSVDEDMCRKPQPPAQP
jgi:disulfide bond formation protein DsbB